MQRITSFRQSRCQPEKDDILATSLDTQRDSDESFISNKAVHFTDGLFSVLFVLLGGYYYIDVENSCIWK
ncbi:hypothetical protein DMB90_27110 [Raoultella planticola]|uniref:Uncharacterized protein n=1 Tax=Raoultella planticola TaxID=575 RepID=A0A5P6AB34_RAOPL|nr:hypothetical protein DMB90_27110 [Raoultella planticola]